jgi:hypothetical protein
VHHQVCAAKTLHPCLRQEAESAACSVALLLQAALLQQAEQAAVRKDCVIQVEVAAVMALLLLVLQRDSVLALALQALYH